MSSYPNQSIQGKNIAVLGGAGFIGSHLIDRLILRGARKIIAVDNLYLGQLNNLKTALESGLVHFIRQDASDKKALEKILIKHNIQAVFNLAVIPLPASLQHPKWSTDHNIMITTTACELLTENCYETLIHFSSSEAYGTAQVLPMTENHVLNPLTPYAASKAACDHIILSFVHSFGINAAIVRPFNNFGPRQNARAFAGIIPVVIQKVLRNEPVIIYGDGEQTRDFIFVTNTADAAIDIYNCPETRGGIFNVGSGTPTSVNHLVSVILRAMNAEHHKIVFERSRPGDVRRHCAGIDTAVKAFGFRPFTDLERGIKETIEWYREEANEALPAVH